MRLTHLIITTALALISFASLAHSQDVISFDRSSFGKAVWSQTESTVTDIQLELSIGDYKNEPIINYSDRSALAQFGRSVGRLDVLTDKGIHRCTAFIVSKQYILTNYHCSIGVLENTRLGATRIEAISFVTGYTQTGVEEGTRKYIALPNAVEFSKELDYAVLEVIGDPSAEYGELKLASLAPQSGDPFWIIGHPMGEGQRVSREKCRASEPAVSVGKLLHTCDTLPGNSGSPVIDVSLRQVVALHHAGSQKDSVNFAILMSEILMNSKVLTAYKAPEVLPTVNAEPIKTVEITPCDALYSAAAEAKACFAYEAYVNSCRDHSLAPIADGYIKKFCQVEEVAEVEEVPEKTVAKKICSSSNPQLCTVKVLCGLTSYQIGNSKYWKITSGSQFYVKEAKRRGLSCGVDVTKLIKIAFKNESVLKRKQLQYALKKLNYYYYKSSIDALYGPRTEKALTGYASAKGININNPEKIFRSVLSQVSVPSSFETAKVSITSVLHNWSHDRVCRMATSGKYWTRVSSFASYVKEARRRGLSCGVK